MIKANLKTLFNNKKKEIDFLKEYIGLIILIPAGLGGFWQLCELIYISPSLIRFFSISQIVPDGLLISLILILSFCIINAFFYLIKLKVKDEKLSNTEINNNQDSINVASSSLKAFQAINFLVFTFCLLLLLYIFFGDDIPLDNSLIIIYIPVSIILIFGTILTFVWILEYFGANAKKTLDKLFFIVPILILLIFFRLIPQFHNSFVLSKDLLNTKVILEKKVVSRNEYETYEILYLNDKYIFIKKYNHYVSIITKKTSTVDELVIIPFEKLIVEKKE